MGQLQKIIPNKKMDEEDYMWMIILSQLQGALPC